MFDLINGVPLHPLVVHAIVVLLPLATLGTIAIALRASWRVRYGPLVVAAAALSTVLIPVATSSGEALERRVGDPGQHAQLGDQLIYVAVPLLVLSAALVWVAWRSERTGRQALSRTLTHVVAALAIVAALASVVQVYRVGDSGARAAWGDVPAPRSEPAGK
ncbi:MAG: hypothetical protein LH477_06810 [Nocardioides sp.]|nr:hypothetical protein [Nocardioides sp.]